MKREALAGREYERVRGRESFGLGIWGLVRKGAPGVHARARRVQGVSDPFGETPGMLSTK